MSADGALWSVEGLIQTSGVGNDVLLASVVDVGGIVDEAQVRGASSLGLATELDVVFCKEASPRYMRMLQECRARVVIGPEKVLQGLTDEFLSRRVFLVSEQPRLLMARILGPIDPGPGTSAQVMRIHPDAQIADGAAIAPGAVIGADVQIGRGCSVGPNTVVDHAVMGENAIIGPNCSIGSDGFSFETDPRSGVVYRFPHFGRVILGNRVVVGANCAIARGSLQDTVIEDDVKLDNLVHVAHNCRVGRGSYLTANVMLAGSATIGAHCWLAPSTAVVNGVTFGDHAMTGLAAAVIDDVPANALMVGVPARKLRDRYRPEDPRPA